MPVKLSQGKSTPRDYVYIKDVVSTFVKALDIENENIEDRIFMIGTGGKLVTLAEAAKIVRDILLYSKIEMEDAQPDRGEFKHRGVISIERARGQLRYEPQYDFRAVIDDYIRKYREFLESRG